MRDKRVDEIRKRIAKRKAEQQRYAAIEPQEELLPGIVVGQQDEDFGHVIFEEPKEEERHPLFRKEVFLMQLLCSAALVLGVGVAFKSNNPSLEQARTAVKQVMGEEFQFAAVSSWYEEQFGKPLTLLPSSQNTNPSQEKDYALPASGGKVLQSFKANGQGVFVQTNVNAPVDAVNEGVAVFVGKKEGLGQTIIIQHADGSESWYGNLSQATVAVYDYVKQKQEIGVVSNSEDGKFGNFYFALKKNDQFIDPIQVIPFE